MRRRSLPVLLSMALILLTAAAAGAVFNLLMPQGVGWRPAYIEHPLWQKAGLAQAERLRSRAALLVDARDAGDYKLAHAAGAVNLPSDELGLLWPLLAETIKAAPAVVVYGRYRSRWPAAQIGQFLREQGLARVYVLEAGLGDWKAAGLPVRAPRRARP